MYRTFKREVTFSKCGNGGNDETVEVDKGTPIDATSRALFQERVHIAISHIDFDHCTPTQIIQCLKDPSLRLISWLKKKLNQNMKAWKEGFLLLNGVDALLDLMDTLGSKRITQLGDVQMVLESVGCIKTLLNSKMGVTYFIKNSQCLKKLIKGISVF